MSIYYYAAIFILSFILTFLYMSLWNKRLDANMTAFYLLIPIINLAFFMLYHHHETDSAIVALKIIYIGGCYLPWVTTMCVMSLCRIPVSRSVRICTLLVNTAVYFAVLSIGRLTEQKGYDIALKAFGLLKQRGVPFHFFIIGAGKLKEELEAQRHELDLEDDVTFLGLRENPYPYIRGCDVVLQSSRWEGKSMVLDEAKILEKPILATRYPTVGDQLSSQEGMVVDMTPEAVAEAFSKAVWM